MADRGFEQDEELSLLWQIEGLTYISDLFISRGLRGFADRVWVIWRLFSIMAERGFELYEDFSPSWLTEGLSKMKTCLHYGKKEGLTYIKTCLHYGRQRVGVIWRLVTIMADRGFELYGDLFLLCPTEGLSKMKTCLHYERQRVWVIWRLFSIMADRGFEQDEDLPPL